MTLGMVDLDDKVHGMLRLGAYGDALGATTEGKPPPIHLVSRLPFSRTIHAGTGGPWRCWLPADRIPADTVGMVTDDTLFRHFLWIPFLERTARTKGTASEESFIRFLEEELRRSVDSAGSARLGEGFARNREAQIRDWLAMFAAARAGESSPQAEACFFKSGQPICFGLFMLPTLAAWMVHARDEEAFDSFSRFLSLDQGHAKEAAGMLGAWTARALAEDPSKVDRPTEWLRESWKSLLPVLRSRGERTAAERIEKTVDLFLDLAREVEGAGLEETCRRLHAQRSGPLPTGVAGLGFDPAEFLAVIAFALEASRDDLHRAFVLIVNSGGDTDTLASVFGQLVGALLGERCLRERCSPEMLEDVGFVDRTARGLFGIEWRIEGLSSPETHLLMPHSTAFRL